MRIDNETIRDLVNLFRMTFNDFDTFKDKKFEEEERDYKVEAGEFFQELLSEEEFRKLLAQDEYQEIIDRMRKIGSKTNLLYLGTPRSSDLSIIIPPEKPQEISEAFFDLFYGDGHSPERLQRYVSFCQENNFDCKWTAPTYYLFLLYPETDYFVKPTIVQWLLKFVGSEHKYHSTPSAELYREILSICNQIKKELLEYEPRDMIDIQSFIWTAEKNYEYILHTYKKFKKEMSGAYLDRKNQVEEFVPVARDIIIETLNDGPLTNEKLSAFIQLFKHVAYKNSETMRRYFNYLGVSEDLWKRWEQSPVGFTAQGRASIRDLTQDQLSGVYTLLSGVIKVEEFDSAVQLVDEYQSKLVPYVTAGIYTPWLHYLRPELFPILNGGSKAGFKALGANTDSYPDVMSVARTAKKAIGEDNLGYLDAMFWNWPNTGYWKIAPGRDAWNWENCRENGFIAIGWDELGDLSGLTKEEFDERNKAVAEELGWKTMGTEQSWIFLNELQVGDKIIANHGTKKILGFGTITSDYYYDPNETKHKHKRNVEWFDTEIREISELSWVKTILPLDKKKYDEFLSLQPADEIEIHEQTPDLAPPFSEIFEDYEQANWAFDLMAKALQELGVDYSNLNDPRFSVTLNKTQDRIRVDYGSWLLLGFKRHRADGNWIEITLDGYQVDLIEYEIGKFDSAPEDKDFRLYLINKEMIDANPRITEAFNHALDFVKTQMGHWKSSNLRKYHREKLAKAVFDLEYRSRLLSEGFTMDVQDEKDEDEYEDGIVKRKWKDIKNTLSYSFDQPFDLSKSKLHFPKEMRQNLENRISTAIRNGKHVLLIGPPGTGKSKLAKAICEFYTGSDVNYQMSTATSDWSTFETIGGYRPLEDGRLEFRSGIFLKSFRHEVTRNPINRWLIIDEINRADIDKAFGALFSALTGDSIKLPYEHENFSIEVIARIEGADTIIEDHHFVIHPDWRIVATMNTYDKTSLYEMSYAFMRRLAFIPVEIPKTIDAELIRGYIEIWNGGDVDDKIVEDLKVIWETINKTRKIGPAIVEDIFKYVKDTEEPDFTSAVIMFVMPQFEGLMDDKIISFVKDLTSKGYDKHGHLKEFCADFFRIEEAKLDGDKK